MRTITVPQGQNARSMPASAGIARSPPLVEEPLSRAVTDSGEIVVNLRVMPQPEDGSRIVRAARYIVRCLSRHKMRGTEVQVEGASPDLETAIITRVRKALDGGELAGPESEGRSNGNAGAARRIIVRLGKEWAGTYDQHMKTTGHDQAVNHLIRQAVALHNMQFGTPGRDARIFGRTVLEAGCGTGTSLKQLCEALRPADAAKLRLIANDLSPDMQAQAKAKFLAIERAHKPKSKPRYPTEDVRELRLKGCPRPDTVIVSQMLPFITDPAKLDRENREGDGRNDQHIQVKTKTLTRITDMLEDGGHLVVIDEWPALFTRKSDEDAQDRRVSDLFFSTFRPLREATNFRDSVIKNIPALAFVCEFKVEIDSRHSMHLMAYRKDSGRATPDRRVLPPISAKGQQKAAEKYARAREAAADNAYEAIRAASREFINGAATGIIEIPAIDACRADTGKCCVCTLQKVDETLASLRAEAARGSRTRDVVVLDRVLHHLDGETRNSLIDSAITATRSGGWVIVRDEWPPPAGNHPIRNRDLRDTLMAPHEDSGRVTFMGTVRQTIHAGFDSGMYAYAYAVQ